MFKKIEIWILYLTIFLSVFFAIFFGALVNYQLGGGTTLNKYNLGWIPKVALFLAQIPSNTKKVITHEPKMDFIVKEDRFPSLAGFSGTPNLKENYLLLSRYDGNLQEGVVELIDLRNFEILHSWNPDIDAFNELVEQADEFTFIKRDINNSRARMVHPELTPDGGLLFTAGAGPLRKINSCSELIFQNTHDSFHHSIETDVDKNIWVSSHLYPQTLPTKMVGRKIYADGGFRDDAIVKLSQDGKILFEKSVTQIFIEDGLEYLLFSVSDRHRFAFDPLHINDIEPVNFDGEFWKKGDVFVSLRHQSMVLLYRPSTNKILWKGVGPFFHQHDIDILDDHRISIFNNNSKDFIDGEVVDGYNGVVIYNFKSKKYSSYLDDSFSNNDVRTITQGRSQILPNGDLFIEETNYGRTLYFNADGSLRWSHLNRADDTNIYFVAWSRILYNQEDIENVKNFLNSKEACNE